MHGSPRDLWLTLCEGGAWDKGGYCKSQTNMYYSLQSDWSFLLLVNIQVVYTVNKVAYRKHCFTTSCDIWNRIYNFLLVQLFGK